MKDGRKRVFRFMTWAAVLCGLSPWTVSSAHALLEWEEMAIPNSGVTCTFNAAMAFKGYLYLGESPGVRVFRTEDGFTLTQVVPDRFGDPDNAFIRTFFLFGEHLYAAVSNNAAAQTQFWRTADGTTWERASSYPGYTLLTHSAAVHNGWLYATFSIPGGTDIARTSNGVTWEGVASFYGGYGVIGAFNDHVYCSFRSSHSLHMEVWRSLDGLAWEPVTTNGFGFTNNQGGISMMAFDEKLYLGTLNYDNGPEIWNTESGVTWSRVMSGGFGDGNRHWGITNLIVAGSQLYAGTYSSSTLSNGMELWRTSDGWNWEQVNLDGFGTPLRYDARGSTAVYQNQLYVEVGNYGSCPDSKIMRGLLRTKDHVPVAVDQELRTEYGQAVEITLQATDDDDDSLIYRLAAPPENGGVFIQGNTALYTPHEGFEGLDRFSFVADDGKMISNKGVITILVDWGEWDDKASRGCFISTLRP